MKVQGLVSRANLLKKKLGRELSSTIEILRFHINKKKAEMNKLNQKPTEKTPEKKDHERRLIDRRSNRLVLRNQMMSRRVNF